MSNNQVVIENPILNSPFKEPNRHFKFDEDGITNEVINERRQSSYFIPIAQPKKKAKNLNEAMQSSFQGDEWTVDRIRENDFINQLRPRISAWRNSGYIGITKISRRLLDYWHSPEREKKLFFCQLEAIETAIYLLEVDAKYGNNWANNVLQKENKIYNPSIFRVAFKMATGTGKTVVMAMIIAWHALNKVENQQDRRFSDTFLIVTPGITIRDRLRVLLPTDPDNYYQQRDLLPADLMEELGKARIVIINYHTFKLRELNEASRLTKVILTQGQSSSVFTETPSQMVSRVCRGFSGKKNIIVINDEAHHCYHTKPLDFKEDILKGADKDDKEEAEKNNQTAQRWITGLEAIKEKIGVKVVYDLSATPFFLRGSGYSEGTILPWVVSDFSLTDAIEAGIVKVPRVPIADDSMKGDLPTYRNLWLRIRNELPRGTRKTETNTNEPILPAALEGAIFSLYNNYKIYYEQWKQTASTHPDNTPPVFIVVCNNTRVSKLIYDFIAGYDKRVGNTIRPVPGRLDLFSNVDRDIWLERPNTILIDSEQLESGEAMTTEFKKFAAHQIEEFKAEYTTRYPGRSAEDITDEDLLREVMNTVGKLGKLGEQIRCVVSVSMLTEGWDTNTVTHILGVRAFSTQLICEQVVGRGLRRMSYETNLDGMFEPEYAEVYGVPFAFIPCSGTQPNPPKPKLMTRVRALSERSALEITFPRVIGYRYDLLSEKLQAEFSKESYYELTPEKVPTETLNAPIIGATTVLTLDDLKTKRDQEVIFLLAKLVLEKYFRADGLKKEGKESVHVFDSDVKAWLFPQVLEIAHQWYDECVTTSGNAFKKMLLLVEYAHDAADRIYFSIVAHKRGQTTLKPILRPYDVLGTTSSVTFDTVKKVYRTAIDKSPVSHVALDNDWEAIVASHLESIPEVISYVKNQSLGFTIAYTHQNKEHSYYPDFIVRLNDMGSYDNPLNLILEVSGYDPDNTKPIKVSTARDFWVPAVNNHSAFGRWAFMEIIDPYKTKDEILGKLLHLQASTV